jgi:hypothetical protein
MFGSRGFDNAAYRVKFLHTRPVRRGWLKFVVVFVAGAVCAVAVVRPEVWSMARATTGAIVETAGAVASTLAAPTTRTPAVTMLTTANAPRIEAAAARERASEAVLDAVREPTVVPASEPPASADVVPARSRPAPSTPEKSNDVVRATAPAVERAANTNGAETPVRAAVAAPQPPADAASASAAAIPEPARPARRTVTKKRTAWDEQGRELVHLYDTVMPDGRRVPVYQRVDRSGLHETDGRRARGFAPPERRRPFSLFD